MDKLTKEEQDKIKRFYDEWLEFWTLTEDEYIKNTFPEVYFAVQKALKYQKEADLLCEAMRQRVN